MFCNNSGVPVNTYDAYIVHVVTNVSLQILLSYMFLSHFIGPNFPTKPNEVDIVHFYNASDIHIGNVKTCQLRETTFTTLLPDIIFSVIIDYDVDIVYIFPVLHLLQAMMKR